MDHFSPLAPAAIRVLVLPVQVENARFSRFLRRLQTEASIIRLVDIAPHAAVQDILLAPKAFPQGRLLFQYTAALPSKQSLQISPFELHREPLLVLGVIDDVGHGEISKQKLDEAMHFLRERHPRVVHRQLIALQDGDDAQTSSEATLVVVNHANRLHDRALWSAMCTVSARFLVELSTFTKAMQASPTVQTPGQTARSLQRPVPPPKDPELRPGSGHGTPPPSTLSPPPDSDGSPRPSTSSRDPPATSFDQMPGVTGSKQMPGVAGINNSDSNITLARTKSRSRPRASSSERITAQGFGTGQSQERMKAKGKARVGIVTGALHLMAGQWSEALRLLIEFTAKARNLSDVLWQAKGLELITLGLLLLAWTEEEFLVPSLCYPASEKSGPGHNFRLSASFSHEDKPSDDPQERRGFQLRKLSQTIPDSMKYILDLYHATEGSLELPFLVPGEAAVRFARLLSVLASTGGTLTTNSLKLLVTPWITQGGKPSLKTSVSTGSHKLLTKAAISDVLSRALPPTEDGVSAVDHITILAGIASAYAILGLDRKKAITLKEMVVRMTSALIQARKLGAAEMGIHPAASLSTDTSADTLLNIVEESRGLTNLMDDLSRTYGVSLVPGALFDTPDYSANADFGNPELQHGILKDLTGFCEASPDPYGLLRLCASIMRLGSPTSALDTEVGAVAHLFTREEQAHLNSLISRTVAVSRHLGLANAEAVYWDPFLVREVAFSLPTTDKAIVDTAKLKTADAVVDLRTPGNPLLYDPNASRPGTAVKQQFVLVHGEASECIVTLQNPLDVAVDVEKLELITEGVNLECKFVPTTLGPLRFQRIALQVSTTSVGETKITGVRIKIHGCLMQKFPIVSAPWAAKAPLTIKGLGLAARPPVQAVEERALGDELKAHGIDAAVVLTKTIDALPSLVYLSSSRVETGVMLLEGEKQALTLTLRNTSATAASVFDIKDSEGITQHVPSSEARPDAADEVVVGPGQTTSFTFELLGKAGVSSTQINFYYCAGDSSIAKFARLVSVTIPITVNAVLQLQHFDVLPTIDDDPDCIQISCDIGNLWPRTITYRVANTAHPDRPPQEGPLAPGELRRICLALSRPALDLAATPDAIWAALLAQLAVTWSVDGRAGAADLRKLPRPPHLLDLVRSALVHISATVSPSESTGTSKHQPAIVTVGAFTTIQITLRNRADRSLPLHVQLTPASSPAGARAERRFLVVGALQRILPRVAADEQTVVEFVICPLLPGHLTFAVTARPAQIGRKIEGEGELGSWYCHRAVQLLVQTTAK